MLGPYSKIPPVSKRVIRQDRTIENGRDYIRLQDQLKMVVTLHSTARPTENGRHITFDSQTNWKWSCIEVDLALFLGNICCRSRH